MTQINSETVTCPVVLGDQRLAGPFIITPFLRRFIKRVVSSFVIHPFTDPREVVVRVPWCLQRVLINRQRVIIGLRPVMEDSCTLQGCTALSAKRMSPVLDERPAPVAQQVVAVVEARRLRWS